MEQNLQNMYDTLDEMVDKDGPVMLIPEFVLCDTALHLQPHVTFSSDGFKIEHFDCDSREDDEMIALYGMFLTSFALIVNGLKVLNLPL